MVEQTFIDKFSTILGDIQRSRGEVSLFAILKMDELTDKWTVIVSASWITEDTRSAVFFSIRDLLVEHLNIEERRTIARIGLFDTSEHLVELILERYRSGDYISRDEKINGNLVHEAFMIAVNNHTSANRT